MKKDDLILEPRNNFDYTPNSNILYDVVIIGTGVAGFSAAMYAKRLGLEVLIIGGAFGGTIMLTDDVENWPGLIAVSGQKLAKLVENHAKDYEIDILRDMVLSVKKLKDKFTISTKKQSFNGKTIIFATGTQLKRLGVKGEGTFAGRGVSYCALCDAMFYKNKTVAVVGGGDSAIKEALLLSEHAKKVYIIHRGDNIHPEQAILKKLNSLVKEKKIIILTNTNVIEVKGDKLVRSVILDKPFQGKKELELDGIFVDIGRVPLSELAKELGVELNKKSEIKSDRYSQTSVKGVFAAGDVMDAPVKQAFVGAAEGIIAAYSAYEFISKNSL